MLYKHAAYSDRRRGYFLAMLLSLVLMNYHFVGDVIAGGFLGGIIAAYAVHLAKLQTTPEEIYF